MKTSFMVLFLLFNFVGDMYVKSQVQGLSKEKN